MSKKFVSNQVGFGTWQLHGETCYNAVIAAIKSGYRLIDTAEAYENEQEIGRAIKMCIDEGIVKREDLYIVTKLNPHKRIGYFETRNNIDKSLNALGVDYIDLFLIHWPNVTPDDRWKRLNAESWRAMEEFYEQGKIKSLGVSNFLEHHLEELYKTAKIKPEVNELNLNPTWPQKRTVEFCKQQGMQIIAWSPLIRIENWNKVLMKSLSEKYNRTAAQISLRWSIQKGYVPLAKSSHPDRIKENIDIFDFEISKEDMATLDELLCHPAEHAATPDSIYHVWQQQLQIVNLTENKPTIKNTIFKLFGVVPFYKNKFCYDSSKKIRTEKVYLFGFIPLLKKRYKNQLKVRCYLFHFIYIGKINIKMNPWKEINTLPVYED